MRVIGASSRSPADAIPVPVPPLDKPPYPADCYNLVAARKVNRSLGVVSVNNPSFAMFGPFLPGERVSHIRLFVVPEAAVTAVNFLNVSIAAFGPVSAFYSISTNLNAVVFARGRQIGETVSVPASILTAKVPLFWVATEHETWLCLSVHGDATVNMTAVCAGLEIDWPNAGPTG